MSNLDYISYVCGKFQLKLKTPVWKKLKRHVWTSLYLQFKTMESKRKKNVFLNWKQMMKSMAEMQTEYFIVCSALTLNPAISQNIIYLSKKMFFLLLLLLLSRWIRIENSVDQFSHSNHLCVYSLKAWSSILNIFTRFYIYR